MSSEEEPIGDLRNVSGPESTPEHWSFGDRLREWNSAMTSMMPSRGSDGQGSTGRYAQRAFDRARTGGALAASRMDASAGGRWDGARRRQ